MEGQQGIFARPLYNQGTADYGDQTTINIQFIPNFKKKNTLNNPHFISHVLDQKSTRFHTVFEGRIIYK